MLPANGARLDSWKAIADFLKVDIRTARRWEKERGLPVYRVPGGGRRAVYTDANEVEAWLRSARLRDAGSNESLSAASTGIEAAARQRPPALQTSPPNNHASGKITTKGKIGWILKSAAVGALALILLLALRGREQETRIDSVSPIYAKAAQTIVIRGHGFGHRPRTIRIDRDGVDTYAENKQTSLVIVNQEQGPRQWIAGRASEVNTCDIGVRLEEWSDSQIVLSGFSGPLGTGCDDEYQIAAGDHLQVQVFGPSNECGPGGVPNCPGEVRNRHIAVFPIQVLPDPNDVIPCRSNNGAEPKQPDAPATK
jgi:hypothetical protein